MSKLKNKLNKSIMIVGGGGYVGSLLTIRLLKQGHHVTVVDNFWFGDFLPKNPNLKIVKMDIREIDESVFKLIRYDVLIHLANIANDPAVELNQALSWEVNVLAGKSLIESAITNGVEKFVYASSGSVYGVSSSPNVTEDHPLLPISAYNKTKMIAERVFRSYEDSIKIYQIRPATVCGMSPRMRLDVSVNMLTFQALKNKKITVFGGDQIRPNIHIDDLIDIYRSISETDNISPGTYNAGFQNISIMQIAEEIQNKIDCEIVVEPSVDIRSYRQDSSKLISEGFNPLKNVVDAINEIKHAYLNGDLVDDNRFYTVKWMKLNQFS